MMTQGKEELQLQALLAEFEALRSELLHRLTLRYTLMFLCISAIGAITSFALGGHPDVLLCLPLVCLMLLLLSGAQLGAIHTIGKYIGEVLSPSVRKVVGSDVFRWEEWQRKERQHPPPHERLSRRYAKVGRCMLYLGGSLLGTGGWPLLRWSPQGTAGAAWWSSPLLVLWLIDVGCAAVCALVLFLWEPVVRRISTPESEMPRSTEG